MRGGGPQADGLPKDKALLELKKKRLASPTIAWATLANLSAAAGAKRRRAAGCGRSSSASTPAPPSSNSAVTPYLYSCYERRPSPGAVRGQSDRQEEDHHPGGGAEPHRPGHRVRLLLRACRSTRCATAGVRDHPWSTANPETVSTDLRHRRSPRTSSRLTAEDVDPRLARGRGRPQRRGARPRSCSLADRRRSSWPSRFEAAGIPIAGHLGSTRSTSPRTATASRSLDPPASSMRQPGERHGDV